MGERGEPLIEAPGAGWRLVAGDGFRIHADREGEAPVTFAESVARGLEDHPRWLDCRWLYDEEGSRIYEAITEQPEYYPTRTEAAILEVHAPEIRRRAGDSTLVELGSGSSRKTRLLLEAWRAEAPTRYVPIDISPAALEAACRELAGRYPDVQVEGVAATYERGLDLVGGLSPLTLMFLGSTVGNLSNDELDDFLETVSAGLAPGDQFLLGIDLVKDPRRLEAAYNDAAGWTARFTRNVFARMNRELDTGIPLDRVEHVALYNDRLERIEIYGRFLDEVVIELPLVDGSFRIAPGEMVLVEISRKFRAREMAANAARFGLGLQAEFTDPDGLFALLLLERRHDVPVTDSLRRLLEGQMGRVRSRTSALLAPLLASGAAPLPAELESRLLEHVEAIARLETRVAGLPALATSAASLREATAALAFRRPEVFEGLRAADRGEAGRRERVAASYRRLLRHEAHRQELVLEELQAAAIDYDPPATGTPLARPDIGQIGRHVLVPGGARAPVEGSAGADPESRQRAVVEEFWIDVVPVTNGQFLAFLEDGGYKRRGPWSQEGWRWRLAGSVASPGHWTRMGGEWHTTLFGQTRRLDPARPVVHVSYWEADAYARWAGYRLPTSAEWQKAALWDPSRLGQRPWPWGDRAPTMQLANLGQHHAEPAPVGSFPAGRSFYGVHQLVGDVWEWTSSAGTPEEGGAEGRILRGGSWATPIDAADASRARVLPPGQRRAFAGFRCVS